VFPMRKMLAVTTSIALLFVAFAAAQNDSLNNRAIQIIDSVKDTLSSPFEQPSEIGIESLIAKCKKAIDINQNYERAHLFLGICYILYDQPENAETSIDRALALSPDDADIHFFRGVVFSLLSDENPEFCSKSIMEFYEVLSSSPNYRSPEIQGEIIEAPEILFSIARCFEEQGDVEKVRKVMQEVIDNYPETCWVEDAKETLGFLGSEIPLNELQKPY